MSKAVNRMMVIPDNADFFDTVEKQALMKTDDEEAGEVMLVTKVVDPVKGSVDVLLLFPTDCSDDMVEKVQPTGIRMTLNAFLNMARMAAVHHKAVVGDAPD